MSKFSEKQIDKIIDSMIIIIDSREKLPNHITNSFDKNNIKWEARKLESGDYTARIPMNNELGIEEEMNFTDILVIERKMSLDEISRNLSINKERFYNEFTRSKASILILIEDNTYRDLAKGNYKSKINPKSFLGLLHSFSDRHNSPFVFMDKEVSPLWIYNIYKYKVKNLLKTL